MIFRQIRACYGRSDRADESQSEQPSGGIRSPGSVYILGSLPLDVQSLRHQSEDVLSSCLIKVGGVYLLNTNLSYSKHALASSPIIKIMNTSDQQIRLTVDNIFQQYDVNNSGSLQLDELLRVVRDIFTQVGQRKSLTEQDAMKVMKAMDTNQDNKVSKNELFNAIKRCVTK